MKGITWIGLLLFFMTIIAHSQSVDCLKYIQSSYAYPIACTSSHTDLRPINVTAQVKCSKNTTWYGYDDWNPFIARG